MPSLQTFWTPQLKKHMEKTADKRSSESQAHSSSLAEKYSLKDPGLEPVPRPPHSHHQQLPPAAIYLDLGLLRMPALCISVSSAAELLFALRSQTF